MSTHRDARTFRARSLRRAALTAASLIVTPLLLAAPASAVVSNCGQSGTHTICVTTPADVLTGEQTIIVTNRNPTGTVIATWQPTGGTDVRLITKVAPSASFGDSSYSFVWPTQKYLNASGVLSVVWGSTSNAPVTVAVTLSNLGNDTDIQHTPDDWQKPTAWTGAADPIVAAVGDGAADENTSNSVAKSVVTANPALFLYLGDIYEAGTYTENRSHYGQSALDGTGTLWGSLAGITQPTVGNHEFLNLPAWRDFWHQRPDSTSFSFGGVLFLNLDSSRAMKPDTNDQYLLVQEELKTAPPCVVAYWHIPATGGGNLSSKQKPMWKLLAQGGGDLVLSGHKHQMTEMVPLDDTGAPGSSAHMVQLIAGSGGHQLGLELTGGNVAWSKGKTAGALYLTLNGAANRGTASSISWVFQDVAGSPLRTGTITC